MNILGIETSCDETAAAVVRDGREILSNIVSSQIELHRPYGGVVPELASRNHLQRMDTVIREALRAAGCALGDIAAVAATYGPGLASSLLVGLNAGKAIAFAAGKPFVAINHIEAHLYSPLIHAPDALPMVSLIVSGGHTILVHATGIGQHRILGQTIDDAAGEAFDKVAKLLKLGYPGGPEIDRRARSGNPRAIDFPRSMMDSFDFSFSGLKTSVLYFLRRNDRPLSTEDICASFQEAVVDVLIAKTIRAAEQCRVKTVSASGGVSINSRFRERLRAECDRRGYRLLLAPAELCTDNAAMIAALAFHKLTAAEASASAGRDFSMDVAPSVGLGLAA
jgi:N6-L-threonylcarbamoyladenine synthase